MYTCLICRFAVELDDVMFSFVTSHGYCICLHCYLREAQTARPMPKDYEREIAATVKQA